MICFKCFLSEDRFHSRLTCLRVTFLRHAPHKVFQGLSSCETALDTGFTAIKPLTHCTLHATEFLVHGTDSKSIINTIVLLIQTNFT